MASSIFSEPPYNILGRACRIECLEGRELQSELRNGVINQAKPSQLKGQPMNRNTPSPSSYNPTESMQSAKRSWAKSTIGHRRTRAKTTNTTYRSYLPNVSASNQKSYQRKTSTRTTIYCLLKNSYWQKTQNRVCLGIGNLRSLEKPSQIARCASGFAATKRTPTRYLVSG